MKDDIDQIILNFSKAFKALQMYGLTHSSFRNFYFPFHDKLADFLKQNNELNLQVDQFTLLHDGRVVYREEEMDLSIAFRLFRDGIRNIQFHSGLSSDELLLFLDVISQPLRDYDVALSLWECNFTHIAFYVVEEEEVLDYKIPDVPVQYVDYDEKLKQLILREKIDIDAVIIPDLKPEEVRNLMRSTTDEERAAILPMVIKTLTDFLRTERSQEIIEGLIEILANCVNTKDFYNARRIAYKLRDYPEVNFIERFENATTILGFRDMLNVSKNELFNEFLAFIGFFSKKSIPFLMQLVPFTEHADRLNALRNRIAYVAQDDTTPLAGYLKNSDTDILINAIAVLGIMKSSDSAALLEPLVNHPNEMVRLEVMDALANIKTPELIVRYMDDPSEEARIKALRLLSSLKYPKAYPVLLDKIMTKNFLNLNFAEQREYFNYLTANADQSLTGILKNLLYKRKWFGRKKYRAMRRLAANALAQIDTEETRDVLKKGLGKRNQDIRSVCETALKGKVT